MLGLGPGQVTAVPTPTELRVFVIRLLLFGGADVSVPAEGLSLPPRSRTWCPVPGCLCADARRHKGWATLDAMKPHLNAHCAGLHDGRIPDRWLQDFKKVLCPECGMVCSARNQCCTRCWPARRAAVPAAVPTPAAVAIDLPSLAAVQSEDIPTLKHVPLRARPQWARALRLALGDVETRKSLDAVVQLMMLPKCCLCLPASGRGGRKHRKQSERYTLGRANYISRSREPTDSKSRGNLDIPVKLWTLQYTPYPGIPLFAVRFSRSKFSWSLITALYGAVQVYVQKHTVQALGSDRL